MEDSGPQQARSHGRRVRQDGVARNAASVGEGVRRPRWCGRQVVEGRDSLENRIGHPDVRVFPASDEADKEEDVRDHVVGDAFSERPDTFKNYKSVEEGLGEAEIELECMRA